MTGNGSKTDTKRVGMRNTQASPVANAGPRSAVGLNDLVGISWLLVENSKPDSNFIWICPGNFVFDMCGNIDVITR